MVSDKWTKLNTVAWHLLQTHVKCDARRHLDRHMAKCAPDVDLTDNGTPDSSQMGNALSGGGGPSWGFGCRCLKKPTYLGWRVPWRVP